MLMSPFQTRLNRRAAAIAALLFFNAAIVPAQAEDWIIGEAQAAPQPLPATPEPQHMFSIAAQPLRNALSAYSIATGLELFYDSHLTAGRTSQSVNGKLTSEAALEALLTGTGLMPMKTSHNVITLIASRQGHADEPAPQTEEATLLLPTLYVKVPDTGINDQIVFAATVRYAIQGALRNDQEIRRGNYSVDVIVWVAPTGDIQRAEILGSTGNARIDTTIAQIVRKVVIGQSPPRGLPQPVHVDILASGAK